MKPIAWGKGIVHFSEMMSPDQHISIEKYIFSYDIRSTVTPKSQSLWTERRFPVLRNQPSKSMTLDHRVFINGVGVPTQKEIEVIQEMENGIIHVEHHGSFLPKEIQCKIPLRITCKETTTGSHLLVPPRLTNVTDIVITRSLNMEPTNLFDLSGIDLDKFDVQCGFNQAPELTLY